MFWDRTRTAFLVVRVWTYRLHCRMFLLWFRRPFDSFRPGVEDQARPDQLQQIQSQHWILHLSRDRTSTCGERQRVRYILTVLVNVVTLCLAVERNEPKLLQGLCQAGWKAKKDHCFFSGSRDRKMISILVGSVIVLPVDPKRDGHLSRRV